MSDETNVQNDLLRLVKPVVGYGLAIALVCLVGWPGSSSVFADGLTGTGPFSPFALSKSVAFCLTFLVCCILSVSGVGWFDRLFGRAAWYVAFPAALMAGGALSIFFAGEQAGVVTDVVCGVLMGVGVSGNFVLWQRVLCQWRTPDDARCLIGGTILGGAVFFFIAWLPVAAVRLIAIALIAPGMTLLLLGCRNRMWRSDPYIICGPVQSAFCETDGASFPQERRLREARVRTSAFMLAPCLAIGAIGFVMQLLRLVLDGRGADATIVGNLYNLGMVLGAVLALFFFERNSYHVELDVFYRLGVPLVALALLLLPLGGVVYAHAVSVLLYTVFSFASIMGILACNQVARHHRVPPTAVYALAFFAVYTFRLLALPVLAAMGAVGGHAVSVESVSLLGVAVLFAVYVLSDRLQGRQEAQEAYSWESRLPGPSDRAAASVGDEDVARFGEAHGLTAREVEVLLLLRDGSNVARISERLCVSPNTVRYHCKNLYAKAHVHSRDELLAALDEKSKEP